MAAAKYLFGQISGLLVRGVDELTTQQNITFGLNTTDVVQNLPFNEKYLVPPEHLQSLRGTKSLPTQAMVPHYGQ